MRLILNPTAFFTSFFAPEITKKLPLYFVHFRWSQTQLRKLTYEFFCSLIVTAWGIIWFDLDCFGYFCCCFRSRMRQMIKWNSFFNLPTTKVKIDLDSMAVFGSCESSANRRVVFFFPSFTNVAFFLKTASSCNETLLYLKLMLFSIFNLTGDASPKITTPTS